MMCSAVRGAKAALEGFEYQIDVSVFVALRLFLITKSATRVILEPANEEDLEVDLEPEGAGRVQVSANVSSGYKLVVQVKVRNSGSWSVEKLKTLLNHGAVREPARRHLDDPGTRYLLITNADVSGVARKLVVGGLEEWPEEEDFPASLSSMLPHDPEGRIGIWRGLGERLLELEMDHMLGTVLRVPASRKAECRMWLRDEARRRMRGTAPGVWTREDLLSVVRSFGGYLASAPELESFVPPGNYESLVDRLEKQNAVVISGPSGTGKTWTASALVDQARQRRSAPEIINVNVTDGPSVTRTLVDTGPKVFYVEDPWGQYSFRDAADAWTEQLPRLLREAREDHQYVVTSRTDMLSQARAGEKLKRWTVVLDADQYRDGELAAIYNKRLEMLATGLQGKALDFRNDALEALETPLEVDLFFTGIADGPEKGEVDRAFYRRIIGRAHRDAVEEVVVSYLSHSDQDGASAVIWVLLAARSRFDRNQLVRVNRKLRIIAPNVVDGLEKLVDRLVATRHLRQPAQVVSFSHPSVRAGFEIFIKENWPRSEAALMSAVGALTQLEGTQRDWGLETAARALTAIGDLVSTAGSAGVEFEADGASRGAIDAWLEESLVDPRADFRPVLQLASDVGTERSIPCELARWFMKGIRRGGEFFLKHWQPPSFDDGWYSRVSADARSFAIADRFVREQLPQDRDGYGDDFASKLDRIAGGLTPAFVAAARRLVASGFGMNVGAVAAGAVRDIEAYEKVLDGALDALADLERSHEREGKEEWRAIKDGERDEGYEEAFISQHEDDGYAAGVLVEAYISQVRSRGRWRTLAKHARASELGYHWTQSISHGSETSVEELRAVISLTESSKDEERAWEAARQHWQEALGADLEERILSSPPDEGLRATLAYCCLMASPITLERCMTRLSAAPTSLVQFLVDLHGAQARIRKKKRAKRIKRMLEPLPPVGKEIFKALALKDGLPAPVGREALSMLETAAATVGPFVLDKIVPVMIASGSKPSSTIWRWLVETEDGELAKAATKAAVQILDDEVVWVALGHARADARVAALEHLANTPINPLPQQLLKLSSDASSGVRRSLVGILATRTHADHQAVLLRLIDDDWSDVDFFYHGSASYPIAREATGALAAYGRLSDEIGETLVSRAERTDDRSLGMVALETAAQCCGPVVRRKIWDLSHQDHLRWVRVDAIDALTRADVVENAILERIDANQLFRLAPPLAASATVLLATHGSIDAVVEAMERVAHSRKWRALVLLGAVGVADRDSAVAKGLLGMLGPDHPARRLLDLADGEPLPVGALDDLGHIRIRRAVERWLEDGIVKAEVGKPG
ncbi:MAG: hypothetical protein OXH68_07360 [Gammaproteobacteria bacterium]|nr:hypothetical protein [Gammaproteobacteria bacterium]